MSKLYKSAYLSGCILILLGLIVLDEYIHTFARVVAGFICTSPYWLSYYRAATNQGLVYDKINDCEHDFKTESNGYDPVVLTSICTKCGVQVGK